MAANTGVQCSGRALLATASKTASSLMGALCRLARRNVGATLATIVLVETAVPAQLADSALPMAYVPRHAAENALRGIFVVPRVCLPPNSSVAEFPCTAQQGRRAL